MLLKNAIGRLSLLFCTVTGLRPLHRNLFPHLSARQNGTSLNYSINATLPDRDTCNLPPPGQSVSQAQITSTATCDECTTVSGVIIGTSVPSNLEPWNVTATVTKTGINDKRAPILLPRAPPANPEPLLDPGPNEQEKFMMKLFESISNEADGRGSIGITPLETQLQTWQIPLKQEDGSTVMTPIGVTGEWFPFGDRPVNYKMWGMSGCTAVYIVGNTGFWAGHFWEGASKNNVNGGSSFTWRHGKNDDDVEERTDAQFQAIAVDILNQPTPKNQQKNRGTFISLADVKSKYDDPFSSGADIFILTKAAGPGATQRKKAMYASKIEVLKRGLRKIVRRSKLTVRFYLGDTKYFESDPPDTNVPLILNGVSILEYTPYEGIQQGTSCTRLARVRIWEELDETPAVDRTWEAIPNVQGPPQRKRGGACILPTNTVPSTSSVASVPPCLPYEDPDNGIGMVCQCSNGAFIPAATGSTSICPWTTIPPQALTTAPPTVTSTNNRQYQYTYTDVSKRVIECESTTEIYVDTMTISGCAGSTAVLYEPPLATMQMGSSQVNVGISMTGEALFTSVSNALMSICPTPTSDGATTSCETGTIDVGEANYLEDQELWSGQLTVHVTESLYNSTDYLNLFVQMVASAANASASGSNCQSISWVQDTGTNLKRRDILGRENVNPPIGVEQDHQDTFCNMNGFLDVQWYEGLSSETAQMWFGTEFEFVAAEIGSFDCASNLELAQDTVGALFAPEFAEFEWLAEAGVQLGAIICGEAPSFNPPFKT